MIVRRVGLVTLGASDQSGDQEQLNLWCEQNLCIFFKGGKI